MNPNMNPQMMNQMQNGPPMGPGAHGPGPMGGPMGQMPGQMPMTSQPGMNPMGNQPGQQNMLSMGQDCFLRDDLKYNLLNQPRNKILLCRIPCKNAMKASYSPSTTANKSTSNKSANTTARSREKSIYC